MRSPLLFSVTAIVCLAVSGCARKEANTGPAATPASQATGEGAPSGVAEAPEIDFSLSPKSSPALPRPTNAGALTSNPPRNPSTVPPTGTPANLQTPEIYFQPPPFYPISLRMQGIEGRVDIGVVLDDKGDIVRAEVVSATAPQFSEYALEAVKAWKFGPARQDGKPVGIAIPLKIPFYSEYASAGMPPRSPLADLVYFEGTFYRVSDLGKLTPASQEATPLLEFSPMPPPDAEVGKTYRASVTFTISVEGQVLQPRLESSNDPVFGEYVMNAIRFWQFVPRLNNGKAQEARVSKDFTYTKPAAP